MNKHHGQRAGAIALAAAGLLGILSTPATAAPPTSEAYTVDFGPGELCTFGVRLDVSGKVKRIGPDPDIAPSTFKLISTNYKVTTTALDANFDPIGTPVTYVATGTLYFTPTVSAQKEPIYEVKATGKNLLFVPGEGLVFVTGNANFALKIDRVTEHRSVSGEARKVNICDPLK